MTKQNNNQACLSGQKTAGSVKSLMLVLVMAAFALAGCQSKTATTPASQAVHKKADTNLLQVAQELEDTLNRALDIHSAGTDTNRLLKELKKHE